MKLKKFYTEIYYALLLLITLGLVSWQHFGMNLRLEIPLENLSIRMLNDNVNGGYSRGQIKQSEGEINLSCDTISSHTFAFCSLYIELIAEGEPSIDLTRFDHLDLTLAYNTDVNDTALVYLLNSEQNAEGREVTRNNLQTIVPSKDFAEYHLELSQFYTPSWWLLLQNSQKVSATANLDQVFALQISTGDSWQERHIQIDLTEVKFEGKRLHANTLYLLLLVVWMLSISVHGIVKISRFSRSLRQSQAKAKELEQLNQFLSIQRDKFESMAKKDALTGCLNRAGIRDTLRYLLEAYQNGLSTTSIILIDIDHFKLINDELGHQEGDLALRNLAALLGEHIRHQDYLVRWGGEEFAVICRDTAYEGAIQLAEHLRVTIATAPVVVDHQITCSFGVAQLEHKSFEDWFNAADRALYQAKGEGRNQVVGHIPSNLDTSQAGGL